MMAYYRLGVVFVLSIMNLDRSFGYLVHDVARLFGRRFDQRALRYVGLNRSQCRILGCLARDEGINQARLAELLEVKPMTLARSIAWSNRAGSSADPTPVTDVPTVWCLPNGRGRCWRGSSPCRRSCAAKLLPI